MPPRMPKVRIIYKVEDKELDALEKQLKQIRESGEKVSKPLEELPGKTKPAISAMGDLKSAVAGIGISAAIGAAIISFAKLTQEINKNRKQVALLTRETGTTLDAITAKARATAQVFDKDFNEVLIAGNTVAKNLGINVTDAMDQINDAMSRGLDINGEYLQTLREYSPFMKQAGIDFRQFNALIEKQLTDGVFSDKGIDAIKEAVISIQEMTPTTEAALKAVGFNTAELIKEIESGAKTYFEVIQEISTKLEDVTDPRVRGQILADVFRGAGEDAGEFALTLNQVGKSMTELDGEALAVKETTDALLASQESLNAELVSFSKISTGIWAKALTTLNEFGAGTLKILNELINDFDGLDKRTKSLTESFATLTKSEAAAELTKLESKASELETTIAAIDAKDEGWFSWIGDNGAKARTDLEDINLQMSVLNGLLEDNEKVTKKIITPTEVGKAAIRRVSTPGEAPDAILTGLDSGVNDGIKSNEQKLQDDLTEISRKGAEKRAEDSKQIAENERQERIEAELVAEEQRQEAISAGVDAIVDIYSNFSQLRIQQIDQQINANELARNRELEQAEGNAQKQDEINKIYDAKQSALRAKQANEEKKSAIFSILVNTAKAVVAALPNIPLSIIIGALGAAQTAFVASQPIPKFAKGVIGLKGPGTETSDSIPAWLSKNESVMTGQETHDYRPTLEAIRNKRVRPEILNELALAGGHTQNIQVNDYDKLASALVNRPEYKTVLDERGFTQYIVKRGNRLEAKRNKYRM